MKFGLKRSVLVRAVAALLVVAAPAFSGCGKTDYAKQQEDHQNEYKVIDDGLIQAYLTRHNITSSQYTRTESGLYLVKISDGPAATETIKGGQQADIKYVGRYLRDPATSTSYNETVIFDNSTDRRVPCGCLSLTVGAGSVIKGWEEALLLMKKGDRKLLLVPSYLAYGPTGSPNSSGGYSIPPDEPLAFDMEVLNVR